jgi:hypothetical protein
MKQGPTPLIAESFAKVVPINSILNHDTMLSYSLLSDYLYRTIAGEEVSEEVGFFIKKTIRAFFGQVDGLAYAFRQSVLYCAEERGMSLTNRERAKLDERRYDKATDSILEDRALLPTDESIKVALKYFPLLFGSSFQFDVGGQDWRGFLRLLRVRDQLAHPTNIERLYPINARTCLQPTLFWFSAQMEKMMLDCAMNMGLSLRSVSRTSERKMTYNENNDPWQQIFKKEGFDLISASAARSLLYVQKMLALSSSDTRRAFAMLQDNGYAVLSQDWQCMTRSAIRTLSADVEATTAAMLFFLNALAKQSVLNLTDSDRERMSAREVEDKFVGVLTIWSREVGPGGEPAGAGNSWEAFKQLRLFRNGLTHPKEIGDLNIDLERAEVVLDALKYFIGSQALLLVDDKKWQRVVPHC